MFRFRSPTPCLVVALAVVVGSKVEAQVFAPPATPASDAWIGDYDARRARFVRVGATDGLLWEWDGFAWRQRDTGLPPFAAPVARRGAAFAFDAARGRCYLFGGQLTTTLGDMWSWDGQQWTTYSSAIRPARRAGALMVYDRFRDRLVLVGGVDGVTQLTDTWEFDGFNWQPGPASPWITTAHMVYDVARSKTLLISNATHTYDGQTWQQVSIVATTPTVRMGYDEHNQMPTLYHADPQPELIQWNGTIWTVVPSPGLPLLSSPVLYHDVDLDRLVIADEVLGGEQLIWDGVQLQHRLLFPQLANSCGFFDAVRNEVVVFSGQRAGVESDSTWTHDGVRWQSPQPAQRPTARYGAAATFDSTRGVGLVFGGQRASGRLADLWSWNGQTWTQLAASGPAPRLLSSLAFDTARGRAVLYGGLDAAGQNKETWEWNGSVWQQVATNAPMPSALGAMAYDVGRSRTVFVANSVPPQTWEWDGVQWTRVLTTVDPPSTQLFAATWNPGRGRMLLTSPAAGYGFYELVGSAWQPHPTLPAASLFGLPTMVYQPPRQAPLLVDIGGPRELVQIVPVAADYGSACGDPAPALMPRATPRLGSGDFALEIAIAPNAIAAIALSATQGSSPAGACTVLLGPLSDIFLLATDARGRGRWPLPIPVSPPLLGLTAFAQGGTLLGSGALATTQGLRIVLGD